MPIPQAAGRCRSQFEIGHTAEIAAVVTGGESKALAWSVNGIDNGKEGYGTITQNCVLDVGMDPPGEAGMNRGFEIVFHDKGTIVRNCRVSGFTTGLFFTSLLLSGMRKDRALSRAPP